MIWSFLRKFAFLYVSAITIPPDVVLCFYIRGDLFMIRFYRGSSSPWGVFSRTDQAALAVTAGMTFWLKFARNSAT